MKRLVLALGMLALLFGAGAVPAQDAEDAEKDRLGLGHLDNLIARDLQELPGAEAAARIQAAEARWQNTGVMVRKGASYRIAAAGEWQAGAFCNKTGPGGQGAYTLLCFPTPFFPNIVPGFTGSALVAKIGKAGKPFGIGEQLEFDAREEGALYLRINDQTSTFDNSGFVTAKVTLLRSPGELARPSRPPERRDEGRQAAPDSPTVAPPTAFAPAVAPAATSQHWAVVVGVSAYADSRIPALRYAATDARAFHDWLVSPEGGRYAPARVRLLLDRDATAANMRDALFNWLRQAIEEDVVVIYFAGHGSPDSPDTPNNLYLLPHDVRYDSIAATGFPMWDIETALKRFVRARRVIVIADACHSGGVGESFDVARRAAAATPANPIATGLHGLTAIGPGIAVLSASDDKQLSAESAQFGGGHGVFTHFLLEGLRGEADYNRDQRITLGELIPYLSEQVRRATRNAQSPTVAGRFDPAISIGR